MRVRGSLLIAFATATDADIINVCMGLLIRPEGSTNVPDASGELEKSWIWWDCQTIVFDVASPSAAMVSARVNIDTKAMRKVKQGDELLLCAALNDESGTGTAIVMGGLRGLYMK